MRDINLLKGSPMHAPKVHHPLKTSPRLGTLSFGIGSQAPSQGSLTQRSMAAAIPYTWNSYEQTFQMSNHHAEMKYQDLKQANAEIYKSITQYRKERLEYAGSQNNN
jgi:hypothetical protein